MEVCTVSKFQQSLNFYVILTWQIFLSISVGYSVIHKVLLKILSGAEWTDTEDVMEGGLCKYGGKLQKQSLV